MSDVARRTGGTRTSRRLSVAESDFSRRKNGFVTAARTLRSGILVSAPRTGIRDPEDLFVHDLAAAYDMEVRLVDTLDEMSRTATDDNLDAGFAIHRTETKGQVRLVERAFEELGREPTRRDCRVTGGLLEEKERFDASAPDEQVRNLRYLVLGIKTERIEITAYEGLLLTAETAGLRDDVTDPLADVLEQERKTLRKLQGLAGESDLETLWNELTDF